MMQSAERDTLTIYTFQTADGIDVTSIHTDSLEEATELAAQLDLIILGHTYTRTESYTVSQWEAGVPVELPPYACPHCPWFPQTDQQPEGLLELHLKRAHTSVERTAECFGCGRPTEPGERDGHCQGCWDDQIRTGLERRRSE